MRYIKIFIDPKEGLVKAHYEDNNLIRVVLKDGIDFYFTTFNGERKLHRVDGPALIYNNIKNWYYRGQLIDCFSQEEFERLIKLKAFF